MKASPSFTRCPLLSKKPPSITYYMRLSLPNGLELSDFVNVSRSSSRLTVLMQNATSGDIRHLNKKSEVWLEKNAPTSMATNGTSINVVFSQLSGLTIRSMLLSTILSIVVISIVIGLALQNAAYSVLSLITNSVPIIVGFGIWGTLYSQMGLAAAVITVITFGIVVDDTVHILSNFKTARTNDRMSVREAIATAFSKVARPMFMTSATIMLGFSVLTLSGFEVNRTLSALTIFIVAAALFIDFLLLPLMLKLAFQKQ